MERPSAQRRQAERRRLWDRRAPFPRRASNDRRTGERRSAALDRPTERRAGQDRRGAERRAEASRRAQANRRKGRRRRETPTPYTAQEMTQLRERFAAEGPVRCPACDGRFTLGPSRRRGADSSRRVVCIGCGRAAVVTSSRAARILLIDQHDGIRDALNTVLSGAGHEVIEANDAAVGLVAYQVVPADVVILDVIGPGRMPAPEFMRRLRALFPEAKVITMAGRSSHRGVDPLAVTQGLGAARTVRMPVASEELLRIVDEVRR